MTSGLLGRVATRLRALPMGVKVVTGVAVVAVVAVSSVLMYDAYDQAQHGSQFCLDCHFMEEPFERFARSAHQGLECEACHRPTVSEIRELEVALRLGEPDSVAGHARVPDEVCTECHIDGDPEDWIQIANTAGHKVHLESDEPELQGLNCVQCHASGVHRFTPTDQTCGQGGCHENVEVQLGAMADLTIHCVTCHDFAQPAEEEPEAATEDEFVATVLQPQADECFSCHEMRALLPDFPPDEPHDGECAVCHNPHEQTTTAEAVQTCASGGCHDSPETLSPYHRGLDPGVLGDCLTCHEAHDSRIHAEGQDNCLECHSDIFEDRPGGQLRISSGLHPPVRWAGPDGRDGEPGGAPVELVKLASADAGAGELARLALAAHRPAPMARDTAEFWHSEHRGVECTACHSVETTHGAVTVTSIRDCRSCHHTAPVAADCGTCHEPRDVRRLVIDVQRTLDITIGNLNRPTRWLPFDHAGHQDLECAECHTEGLTLSASTLECASCHEEHHEANNNCMACHAVPADDAHDAQVHLGCGGAGCHEAIPTTVAEVPRTRDFCLVCHQDLTTHRPGRNCEDCHALPRPRAAQADLVDQEELLGLMSGPHPADR